ncbi:hypothetical protein JCM11251_001673 [Rhodosporidiobolus azoricus]
MLSSPFSSSLTALLALTLLLFARPHTVHAQEGTSGPSVTSPSLYQCGTASFGYTCDAAPCTIVIRPSDDASKQIAQLADGTTTAGAVPWKVTVAEGTSVTAWITNAQGVTKSNAASTVYAGNDDCLNGSSASTAVSSGGSSSSGSAASGARESASSAGASQSGSSPTSSGANANETGGADSDDNGAGSLAVGGLFASTLAVVAFFA